MDDHEENTEKVGSSNATQRGIFSTEELTVETENVPEEFTSSTRDSAATHGILGSRRARRTSNTRASYAPDTMDGDIVIDQAQPSRKRPMRIVVICVIVVLSCGLLFAILSALRSNRASLSASFEKLATLMQDGPDDIEVIEENCTDAGSCQRDWFITTLDSGILGVNEQNKYIERVTEKYADYKKQAKKNRPDLDETNDAYARVLDTVIALSRFNTILSKIDTLYIQAGEQATWDYINQVVPSDPTINEDDMTPNPTEETVLLLREYADNELSLVKVASSLGCTTNDEVNYFCDKLASSSTFQKYATSRRRYADTLNDSRLPMNSYFINETIKLYNLVTEGTNEK